MSRLCAEKNVEFSRAFGTFLETFVLHRIGKVRIVQERIAKYRIGQQSIGQEKKEKKIISLFLTYIHSQLAFGKGEQTQL